MSDHYKALTVSLETDIKDEYAAPLIAAIKQLRGVLDVRPSVMDLDDHANRMVVRHELGEKLWHVLYPKEEE